MRTRVTPPTKSSATALIASVLLHSILVVASAAALRQRLESGRDGRYVARFGHRNEFTKLLDECVLSTLESRGITPDLGFSRGLHAHRSIGTGREPVGDGGRRFPDLS